MRSALFAALAAVSLAPLADAQNVLLVVADDLGTDKVGAYQPPSPAPPTPTIDALADGGVRFDNAWACPSCSPTRATLLTGRYPFRHGVKQALPFGDALPYDELTIPAVLDLTSTTGGPPVSTAAFGKWHLADDEVAGIDPLRRGFDYWAGNNLGGLTQPFSYFLWPYTQGTSVGISTDYATTEIVDEARDWIASQEQPWFCYLSFHAPHTPFHAPPDELHTQALPDVDPNSDPVPFFDAMAEAMDRELGRLLAEIDPAVLAETTIIVVGDNGSTGDVVLPPNDPNRSKGSLYQNGVRVPLIVNGPDIAAPGRSVASLVDVSDLFATSLELLGADWQPALPAELAIDSVSLLPYLAQPVALPQRSWAFTQIETDLLPGDQPTPTGVGFGFGTIGGGALPAPPGPVGAFVDNTIAGAAIDSGVAIRGAIYKLIRRDNGQEQLFNLALDPLEENNLLGLFGPIGPASAAYDDLSATLDELMASE